MIRSGDVFGIRTSGGEAYFQYVKKVAPMGSLIRVLPGVFADAPADLESLVAIETNFRIFFPAGAAFSRGIVRKVGRFAIPDHSKNIPVFRAGVVDPAVGKVVDWWLWDGETEWRVGSITDEQRKLPIRGSWNDTMLKKRIEEGWLPEHDPR
ncbi:hypothetical protein [Paraburkholderia mimosarum]|uniref:hypothetical protein n=1 Tax=Paraburkholderia mimosarum TaxID=312026 RepID=UPI0003F6E9C0|nr:hypothetical protein [Paraburkholderia mimosarum]